MYNLPLTSKMLERMHTTKNRKVAQQQMKKEVQQEVEKEKEEDTFITEGCKPLTEEPQSEL